MLNVSLKYESFAFNIFDCLAHSISGRAAEAPCSADFFARPNDSSMASRWDQLLSLDHVVESSAGLCRTVPWTEQSLRIWARSRRRRAARVSCRWECACIHAGKTIYKPNDRVGWELCNSSMAPQNDWLQCGSSRWARTLHSTATRTATCARCACGRRCFLWTQRKMCPLGVWRRQAASLGGPATRRITRIEYKLISPTALWTKIKWKLN